MFGRRRETAPVDTTGQYGDGATTGTTGTTGKHNKHVAKRGLAFFLVFINLALFILALCITSYLFNSWCSNTSGALRIFSELSPTGRPGVATLAATFISCVVGIATMLMAAVHGGNYTEASRFASLGSNLIAFALVCLAAGFSIKTLIEGHTGGKFVKLAITVAACNLILVVTMFLYLLALGLFKNRNEYHNSHYGNNYTTNDYNNTTGTTTTSGSRFKPADDTVLPHHHKQGYHEGQPQAFAPRA